jgi:hypothetical protein
MIRTLKVIAVLVLFSVSFGVVGPDEGQEVPGTRTTIGGGRSPYIQPGKTLEVDAQNRVHVLYGTPGSAFNLIFTDDLGETWSLPTGFPPGNCDYADLACDDSGLIYVAVFTLYEGTHFSYSQDGGQTWSTSQLILPRHSGPFVFGESTLDWGANTLFLVCSGRNYDDPKYNLGLYLMTSQDTGKTWSDPLPFYYDTLWRHQPQVMASRDSTLAVLWCENAQHEMGGDGRRLLLFATEDTGQTWQPIRYPHDSNYLWMGEIEPNGGMYWSTDVEITNDGYYVAWDSTRTLNFASSEDKGETWQRQVLYQSNSDMWCGIELATSGSLVAALLCGDGKTWLQYSTNEGKDWSIPRLIGEAVDFPGTWHPRLVIDRVKRIHVLWSQSLDSTTAALFYYCDTTFNEGITEGMGTVNYELSAFPNPFSNRVNLHIGLDADFKIEPVIYDASGRLVRGFGELNRGRGLAIIDWDGRDDLGRRIPAGSYFLKVKRGEQGTSLKIVKVR